MDNLDKEKFFRRRGRIFISGELFNNFPEEASALMSHMLIANMQYIAFENRYECCGYSERFDEVDRGSIAPEYRAERIGTELVFTRLT